MLRAPLRNGRISYRDHVAATFLSCVLLFGPTAGCETKENSTDANDANVLAGDVSENNSGNNDASQEGNAMVDAETDSDGDVPDAEPPRQTPEVEEGQPCERDEQCDDHVFCNGEERCAKTGEAFEALCKPAPRLPCSTEHPCREILRNCACEEKNLDGDGFDARECGGDDCNDGRADCFPGATEVCDPLNEDEDCDPATYNNQLNGRHLDGDVDDDGYVDEQCRNHDPDTGEWHGGIDCLDREPTAYPGALEICDYYDNNCNGYIDERTYEDGSYDHKDNGLRNTFVLDRDGDLHGDANGELIEDCIYIQPPGFIVATNKDDCNDENSDVHPGAREVCDGIDNDCDTKIDKSDDDFRYQHFFAETVLDCQEDREIIIECPEDKLWCPEHDDPLEQGCRSDATRLSSCRKCSTNCKFSCGVVTCDELQKVAAGGHHTCGLTQTGRVACWGRGSYGRLGNDSIATSATPVWAVGITDAKDVAVGFAHSCATTGPHRTLWCWGRNASGQVGLLSDSTPEGFVPTPARVLPPPGSAVLDDIIQISAGLEHTCAVQRSGAIFCFGDGTFGRLGNNLTSAGPYTASAVAWIGFDPDFGLPVKIDVDNAISVAAGNQHNCALLNDGTVACWGDNSTGQLGSGTISAESTPSPTRVPSLSSVTAIAAGAFHNCALSSGRVFCWGRLGPTAGDDEATPKQVPDLDGIVAIAAGSDFTCAQSNTNRIHCWGSNGEGQLGSDAPKESVKPLILAPQEVTLAQGAGLEHMCALRLSGEVFCWGSNFYGQLGKPALQTERFSPISPALGEHR